MLTDTSIKFLNSTNLNSPLLNTDWGALIRIYDACLVDGINPLNISSLTMSGSSPSTSDIVTLTYLTPHGYQQYQVLLLTGAEVSALNGEHRILSVSSDGLSLTFKISTNIIEPGNILNIITKLAPLGWTKVYSGTNRAVYKMNSVDGPNHCFFVLNDDPNSNGATSYTSTYSKYATTGLAENIGVGFNPQGLCNPPTWSAIYPSGSGTNVLQGWGKVYYATSSAALDGLTDTTAIQTGNRRWEIFGDSSYFYLFNGLNTTYPSDYAVSGCGQYDCIHKGYTYNTFIANNVYDTKLASNSHNISIDQNQLVGFQNERNIRSLSNLYNYNSGGTLRIRSIYGLIVSGYNSILNVNSPVNLLKMYCIDADSILMGAFRNIYWVGCVRPFINGQIFKLGDNVYKAINVYRESKTIEGQLVVKLA